MAKKKRVKRVIDKSQQEDDKIDDVNQNDEDFFHDEIDKFHADKEKILLESKSDDEDSSASEEEEVLGIDVNDSEDDYDQYEESDENEENEDQGIVSGAAWGKKKSSFYGADTLEGLEGSDREEAEREEENEVLAIQKRLAEQIDEDDFGLDILQVAGNDNRTATEDVLQSHVIADFSALSRKAQWKLAKKESPELDGLIQDFKTKLSELETELTPLMNLVKRGKIPQGFGSDYINLKYRVYFAYLLNISFYLALKTSKTHIQNHPIISRLVQYRTVINQLAPIDRKLRTEIEELLQSEDLESNNNVIAKSTNVSDGESSDEVDSDSSADVVKQIPMNKLKRKLIEQETRTEEDTEEFSKSLTDKLTEDTQVSDITADKPEEVEERRAINQEIAKNKGLRPKRQKINRNPRVKMRHKYNKAKIRRKGQVREYRPEIKKYGGEASGIRVGLKKSITLQ